MPRETKKKGKTKCKIPLDKVGLGVSIEAAEEKNQVLCCNQKIFEVLVNLNRNSLLLQNRSQERLKRGVQWVLLHRRCKSIVFLGESL